MCDATKNAILDLIGDDAYSFSIHDKSRNCIPPSTVKVGDRFYFYVRHEYEWILVVVTHKYHGIIWVSFEDGKDRDYKDWTGTYKGEIKIEPGSLVASMDLAPICIKQRPSFNVTTRCPHTKHIDVTLEEVKFQKETLKKRSFL